MARQKQSSLKGAKDFAGRLPWAAWLGLAVLSFALLDFFPGTLAMDVMPEMSAGSTPRFLGTLLTGAVPYLVPGLFFLAGLLSFARRAETPKSSSEKAAVASADPLAALEGQAFNALVARGFRREGYLVVERAGNGTADRGVDLELFMGRDRYLVLCRRWRETRVELATVRELYRVMSAERAVGGFIVTSGKFTDEARSLALGRSIRLLPADSLRMMLASAGEMSIFPNFSRRRDDPVPPACPLCGKAMMPRVAHRGERAGKSFWGCTSYPACRGFREM